MSDEIARTRELLQEASALAKRSGALRTQVRNLSKRAASIRETSTRLQKELQHSGKDPLPRTKLKSGSRRKKQS